MSPPNDINQLAILIRNISYNAYLFTLVGNPAPTVENALERMQQPITGDLVIEISTAYSENRSIDAVGHLEKIVQEPVDFGDDAETWNEEEGQSHPKERVFYITTLDGRQQRWTNANFIAVPSKLRRTPLGT